MAHVKGQVVAGSIEVNSPVTFKKAVTFSDTATFYTNKVTITNAQIKTLRATPKTLVAAPGVSKFLDFLGMWLFLDYGSNVLSESTDNLAVKYNNGSGYAIANAEAGGFIDASADTWMYVGPGMNLLATFQPIPTDAQLVNKALVLHNTGDGEYGGNAGADTIIYAYVSYRVVSK